MGRRKTTWKFVKKLPKKYAEWIRAAKGFELSAAHVQMARELSMTVEQVKGFHKLAPEHTWGGLPLGQYIERRYLKKFGIERPKDVLAIESQLVKDWRGKLRKKALKRERLTKERKARAKAAKEQRRAGREAKKDRPKEPVASRLVSRDNTE